MTGPASIHENLVIGGGLAGAMVAIRLAAAGREVLLLEKERGAHHKVCGEFLSPEAIEYLRNAGVDPPRLGAALIESLRLSARRSVIQTRLPFRALSVSRCVLDAALLAGAEAAGCEVRRGVTVRSLARDSDGWIARFANGTSQQGRSVFLATGKHDLRGWIRPPGRQSSLVGFKMHWRLRPAQTRALRGFIDLFLFEGGYGGLALVEGDVANLCFVIRRSRLRRLGEWSAMLAALCEENALTAERLDGAVTLWERPLAISTIPYGYLPQSDGDMWRVGDQATVIPSFTGDGMAIALHSGALAAEMYLSGKTPNQYHRALRGQLQKGVSLATLLSQTMVSRAGHKLAPILLPFVALPVGWIARLTRIPERKLRPAFSSEWQNR